MAKTRWATADLVVVGLGAALVVFFAGVATAISVGHTPPTEMWAAGSAVSGALIGLLVPQTRHKGPSPTGPADPATAAGGTPSDKPPLTPQALTLPSAGTPIPAAFILLFFFVATLVMGVLLAAGTFVPPKEFVASLQSVTTAVIALASAAGSALIGLLAPVPGDH
jgi:hypothetical protein